VPRNGRYDIVVSLSGFSTVSRKGLKLERSGATVVGVPLMLDPDLPERVTIE
jgi:hypothetical protein